MFCGKRCSEAGMQLAEVWNALAIAGKAEMFCGKRNSKAEMVWNAFSIYGKTMSADFSEEHASIQESSLPGVKFCRLYPATRPFRTSVAKPGRNWLKRQHGTKSKNLSSGLTKGGHVIDTSKLVSHRRCWHC
jgi:hypothetical protein